MPYTGMAQTKYKMATAKKVETPQATETPVINNEVAQATTQVAPVPEKVYDSEELAKIRTEIEKGWDKVDGAPRGSKEKNDALAEVYKLQNSERAEILKIQRAENEAAIALKRNERIKLFDNAIELYDTVKNLHADGSTASTDEKNAANDAYQKAADIVRNELLARFSGSTPSATVSANKPAGAKGATSIAIREKYIAARAAGINDTEARKQLVTEGYNDGTVGSVVYDYLIEIGERAPRAK